MEFTFDEYDLEAFDDDGRVERGLVKRAGRRFVRHRRVVDEQDAQAQAEHVEADVQCEHADEAELDVQVTERQEAQGGGQRQDGGREAQPHGAAALVRHVGQVREHADQETMERARGRGRERLCDTGDGGRHVPEHGEQYVESVAQYLPEHRHEHERPAPAPVVVTPRPREHDEHERHQLLDDVLPHVYGGHGVLRLLLHEAQRRVLQVRCHGRFRVASLAQQQVRAHGGRDHGGQEVTEQHWLHRHRAPYRFERPQR